MNRCWISSTIATGCTLILLAATLEPRSKKGDNQAADPGALVWPGPPEKPRIRYLQTVAQAGDVTGKVKPSFFERLSGRSAAHDQLQLVKPCGVAVDRNGRVFVADPAQRAVLVFDLAGRKATNWGGNAQFPLFVPVGVALDGQGRVFVADSFAARVVVFTPDGKPVAAFGKGTFGRPGGMAVDDLRGRLYVADVKLDKLLIFDLRDLKQVKAIGGTSAPGQPEAGRFSGPTNVALNSKGRIYVTDTWNCRVQAFDPSGQFVLAFGTQGVRPSRFVRPKGIAIDSEDHVYVVDAEFNNFQVLTAEGKPLLFVGSMGAAPGQFLLPTGMAIDNEDRIYVTEQRMTAGRMQVFQYLSERAKATATAATK